MALNFPITPTLNQIYTVGSSSWKWDGSSWNSNSTNEIISLTGAGTSTVTGTFPNLVVTSNDQFSGTVTSVGGTGTVSGLTLSGTVTSSGNLTLGGTLAVTASNFSSQTANTVLAAPNGASGVPTFRTLVTADLQTVNTDVGSFTNANVTVNSKGLVTAVSNGGIPELLDVHGQTDGTNCVFSLRQNQTLLSDIYIKDSKDLEVSVSGERYSPYASQKAFAFMPMYEVDSNTFRVRENRLIIYNAPEVGAKISVVVRKASTTPQIRRYPFSATTIGLGD